MGEPVGLEVGETDGLNVGDLVTGANVGDIEGCPVVGEALGGHTASPDHSLPLNLAGVKNVSITSRGKVGIHNPISCSARTVCVCEREKVRCKSSVSHYLRATQSWALQNKRAKQGYQPHVLTVLPT